MAAVQTWELWFPDAAATGLLFARARIAPADVLWVHAAPPTLAVTVRDGDDRILACADNLARHGERLPMTRLAREGDSVDGAEQRREPGAERV